jgi:hypothetical protein
MISVLKLNLITDDQGLPEELREGIEKLLQQVMRDDPEGHEHAHVALEWKQTVMPRSYMETLGTRPADRIKVPAGAPAKARPARAAARR